MAEAKSWLQTEGSSQASTRQQAAACHRMDHCHITCLKGKASQFSRLKARHNDHYQARGIHICTRRTSWARVASSSKASQSRRWLQAQCTLPLGTNFKHCYRPSHFSQPRVASGSNDSMSASRGAATRLERSDQKEAEASRGHGPSKRPKTNEL